MTFEQYFITVLGFRSGPQHFVVAAANSVHANELAYNIISLLDTEYQDDSFTLHSVTRLEASS